MSLTKITMKKIRFLSSPLLDRSLILRLSTTTDGNKVLKTDAARNNHYFPVSPKVICTQFR